jgi:hypothetical protein
VLANDSAFPFAGSFALYCDPNLPKGARRPELARILEHGDPNVLISLPLRLGADGNRRVELTELIDGTPLSEAEEAELKALRKRLLTARRGRAALQARFDALRSRSIHLMILRAERAKWAAAQAESRRQAA